MSRTVYCILLLALVAATAALGVSDPASLPHVMALGLGLTAVGLGDALQKREPVRRNSPLLGRAYSGYRRLRARLARTSAETNGAFAPATAALVRARARGETGMLGFGPRVSWQRTGHLSARHSLAPVSEHEVATDVLIGGPACTRQYRASLLNISALSAGALSPNAILALGRGARLGGFFYNTGEGGLDPAFWHSQGDLVWQVGTGYFGCRTREGRFDAPSFADRAGREQIKMIEVKLSQGAKPGHGGILPGRKVSRRIAESCGIPVGRDSLCPAAHSAFATPIELLQFLHRLRELAGGKPVGIKLCLGRRSEFLSLCKAMAETGISPDFVTVDGAEGGAGAAPPELANHLGAPLHEALPFVHAALVGIGVRDQVRVIASGRIADGFDMMTALALGADLCAAARAFMLALGCMQSLRCEQNTCPTGIATQSRWLGYGIAPDEKRHRVAAYHRATVASCVELMAAMGISSPRALTPAHLWRQTSAGRTEPLANEALSMASGDLLAGKVPPSLARDWARATVARF
ncbi:glutamate synthase-related protein [Haliangium sp.]|uniref:glutamate synthase-related protein n=1 Tax=Haliangium sp. TaxID=2663208 RepID=UPI003D0BF572